MEHAAPKSVINVVAAFDSRGQENGSAPTPITSARQVPPVVSVIVPLRDEESTLAGTLEAVGAVLDRQLLPYELIFVDDGSTDSSPEVLASLVRSRTPHFLRQRDRKHRFARSFTFSHIKVRDGVNVR